MTKKDIQERTLKFSVRIVNLCKFLRQNGGTGYDLSKQLIRSGTSIGANVEEAQNAESKRDFIHKMSISLKEARETNYWLKILIATEKNLEPRLLSLLNESNELISIIHAIIKNTKAQN
ncbi:MULTISPECIES: four helix bundle protein [unclassified Moorena]|uniref:four helix bundle protein n=1 Tax=unclassified Moorena TaxID=2683338 RepID=UPI0013BA22DA|nr:MULTISPECIES: four helix bundle protein [unclassified Moorena]NEQ17178.1 four helix bundle protein [Moorena sp. SIO3E2]NEP37756.1 four helix bundle protein [Moorena sp. SIO3B2]NEQ11427.1 four helix bundle protein [Moorena sp. SIO4E2]NER91112.1 four helix bundle protein [Moorena sp. SIO3A2]NES46933.1 four helix bundle protein [Moorena sp. SIO2C4]